MTEPVGALGDEAARLFAAAEQWWNHARGDGERADSDPGQHRGPECTVCPVCQLLSAIRTSRPELFEHLTSAATSLMHAVRSTFESSSGGWTPQDGAPVVERIDVR